MTLARSATLLLGVPRQSLGHRQKCRRETDRIDHDEQRHQRRNGEIKRHAVFPSPLWARAGCGVGRLRASFDACENVSRPPPQRSAHKGEGNRPLSLAAQCLVEH